jgi:transposase-like protein
MEKPQTLQQVIQHFSEEQVCIDAVAKMRWPNGVECPACSAKEPYWIKTQKRWKCRDCRRQFSVKLGSIFEDSPIPLQKWLPALWMLVNCRNGISSYEIQRDLGVSQKAGWFMLHRLRLVLKAGSIDKLGGPGNEVELDESFVGGSVRNMHKGRRLRINQARSEMTEAQSGKGRYANKTAVFGVFDREQRKVRATVVPTVKRAALQAEILRQVQPGSKLYTDESPVYSKMAKEYAHEIVNHLQHYVDGRVHTNGLENFWSLLKRGLNGTYVSVEPFHLFRYVDEQAFRFNNRKGVDGKKLTDAERFDLALSQVAGKRLTFAEVTGKDSEQPF